MALSFQSINTGLPKDIVQKIIEAEKIPVKRMEVRKEKVQAKKALLQDLINRVRELRDQLKNILDERTLREFAVNTNNDIIGVTVDKNAALPGNYTFEVDKLAQKSSIVTNGVEDRKETYFGVGYISYETPDGGEKEIYVDAENSSLDGIAKLINQDEDNGMYATVINDGTGSKRPWRLIVSLTDTGDDKNAEFPYFYMVDGEEDLYVDEEREAHDAVVKVDGYPVEVSSNKVKDLIPGVTIDLKKARPGEEFNLNIGEDAEKIGGKIGDFVEKLNAVLMFIKEQNSIDQNTDTSRTLGGDLTLQTLESRLRSAIFKPVKTSEGMKRLSQLGITFQKSGLLEVDKNKFDALLNSDFKKVVETLTGVFEGGLKSNGVVHNLKRAADDALRFPSGILTTRDNGLKSNIRQIDRQIENRLRIIDNKEKMLKDKFSRLESTMANIQSAGSGLAALTGNAKNFIQQLG